MQEAEHHGDRWFKDAVDLREAIRRETGQDLGATKTFGQGALTPDDEGELRFAVMGRNGKVILAFGKPIEWLGVTPQVAREFASKLVTYADRIEREERDAL